MGAITMAPIILGAIVVSGKLTGLLKDSLFDKINKYDRYGKMTGRSSEPVIDKEEFAKVCDSDELFKMLDHDGSGLIDYYEFQLATLMLNGCKEPGQLFEWLFMNFDTTGDMKLTKKEFHEGISLVYTLVDLFSEGQLKLQGKRLLFSFDIHVLTVSSMFLSCNRGRVTLDHPKLGRCGH
jgi:hypothetical protein